MRKALAAAGFRFTWIKGPAELVLWVVDVEAGVPEGTRDRFRKTFETAVPRLVVFLAGGDRVPADRSFLPELVELDVRGLLDEALRNCESEPIHIPGSIQPHGMLLGIDPARPVFVESES